MWKQVFVFYFKILSRQLPAKLRKATKKSVKTACMPGEVRKGYFLYTGIALDYGLDDRGLHLNTVFGISILYRS